jgi:Ca2+-binding RTX toxin-like protein
LQGGTENEFLYGGAGNDKLTGGAGNDYLSGGPGSDTFIFGARFGKDVVSDFQNTGDQQDLVQFDHGVFADFSSLQSHMVQQGTSVVITADANSTIEVQDTRLDHLTADYFLFV